MNCLTCLFIHFIHHAYLIMYPSPCLWTQAVYAVGMFELQIRHFQNPHGLLQTGDCCDLQATGGQRCSARDQCDTFFQACLKEYQARVVPTGACTFGSGSTGILGGNSQSSSTVKTDIFQQILYGLKCLRMNSSPNCCLLNVYHTVIVFL
uniref:Notch ligand N-terminal domain-containing protein n=1 Tax=Echeneis naucrates TaxID=173247 RepID=A0A665UE81_ECHNA